MSEFISPFVSVVAHQLGDTPARGRSHADKSVVEELRGAVDALLVRDVDVVMVAAVEIARAARRGRRLPVWAAIRVARSRRVEDPMQVALSGVRCSVLGASGRVQRVPPGVSGARVQRWLDARD